MLSHQRHSTKKKPPSFDAGASLKLACSFQEREVHFIRRPGVSSEETDPSKVLSAEQLPLFLEIVKFTQTSMRRMNKRYPALPPDTCAKTLDLVTRPGARTIVLEGITSGAVNDAPKLLGYGIEIQDKSGIPDLAHIPKHLAEMPHATRMIRLFVSNTARKFLSRGEAFSRILGKITEPTNQGPIIGMVLTDVVPVKGDFSKFSSSATWLEAKQALEKRGFQDTGHIINEKIKLKENREVLIAFRWYVYPPFSKEGIDALNSHQERFAALKQVVKERLSTVASAIPYLGASTIVTGQKGDPYDIAYLYPGNQVIGGSFTHRSKKSKGPVEKRPNLISVPAPIDGKYVAPNSVQSAVVFGVLPDIAGRYPKTMSRRIHRFLSNQIDQLATGGTLVVRDTISAVGYELINVDLDRVSAVTGTTKSMAELFQEFILKPSERHIPSDAWKSIKKVDQKNERFTRFIAPQRIVHEFLLKVAYYKNWELERKRSYTVFTPDETVKLFNELGTRHITSIPQQVNYLRSKYLNHKVRLWNLNGERLDIPALNYLTIAQKVGTGEGVRFQQSSVEKNVVPKFLQIKYFSRPDPIIPGKEGHREMVKRPGLTVDVIPYCFSPSGQLLVTGRLYPRPITTTTNLTTLDGSSTGGYLSEQIAKITTDEKRPSQARLQDIIHEVLDKRTEIGSSKIKSWDSMSCLSAHPQMMDEEIVSQAVEIDAPLADKTVKAKFGDDYVPYQIHTFDALTLLHGSQTGISEDARLERAIYKILRERGMNPGPWLGEKPILSTQHLDNLVTEKAEEITNPTKRQVFKESENNSKTFFEVNRSNFEEIDSSGKTVSLVNLEYVCPTNLSSNSISVLPVMRCSIAGKAPELYVGIFLDDAPAVQERTGSSHFASLPIFHLPKKITGIISGKDFIKKGLAKNLELNVHKIWELGGKFRTSPGCTPELVTPMLAEVDVNSVGVKNLKWISLEDLSPHINKLYCAQLVTSLRRAEHALK